MQIFYKLSLVPHIIQNYYINDMFKSPDHSFLLPVIQSYSKHPKKLKCEYLI